MRFTANIFKVLDYFTSKLNAKIAVLEFKMEMNNGAVPGVFLRFD